MKKSNVDGVESAMAPEGEGGSKVTASIPHEPAPKQKNARGDPDRGGSNSAGAGSPEGARELRVEWVDTASVRPYERNPRHNLQTVDKLAASIREFGWRQPIVVDGDGVIVVGHTRLMAAQRLGLQKVPVHVALDLTPAQAKAYRLADNRVQEESDWDEEFLAAELKDLQLSEFDLSLTGFSAAELDEYFADAAGSKHLLPDPDEVPPVPETPKTRLGDVWVLGRHRLRCGDARRLEDVRAATDNQLADIVWTDPPYNVDYEGKTPKKLRIDNDDMEDSEFAAFLLQLMRCTFKNVKDGAPIYVAHADTEGLAFRQAFVQAGFKLSGCLIWRKDSLVLGRSDYQWQHEPILYGWKPGKSHPWYSGRREVTFAELEKSAPFVQLADGSWQLRLGNRILTIAGSAKLEEFIPSVIDEKRPQRSNLHPTMKPTALIERMLKNSAKSGDLVLDVCGGSGSTLIAAERLGMRAALVELSPAYCDVIVRRWAEYTGGKPELVPPIPAFGSAMQ